MNFNSQVCTSRKQSERLLALGIKKETADMFEKVIRESDANPQIVIDNLKSAFEYE